MNEEMNAVFEEIMNKYGGEDLPGLTALLDKIRPELEPKADDRYDKLKADYIARFFGRVVGGDPAVDISDSIERAEDTTTEEVEETEEETETPKEITFSRKKEEVED